MIAKIISINSEFLSLLRTKSIFEKTMIFLWTALPFFMMLGQAIGDGLMTLMAIALIVKSFYEKSWEWLKLPWVKWATIFVITIILSSIISQNVTESFLNGISWIRFPLFAVAISFWLVRDEKILKFMLLLNLVSILFLYLLMSIETYLYALDQTEYIYNWPFSKGLNGGFLHRAGIIFFAISFIYLFNDNKYKFILILFVIISFIFSLLTAHRAGTFNFAIIIFIVTFFPSFKLKKALTVFCIFILILSILYTLKPPNFMEYLFMINNLQDTSMLTYFSFWKAAILTFLDSPILGLGPSNFQNYLKLGIIENNTLFAHNEHPHNHYLQSFVETGIIGGFAYCMMIISLFLQIYQKPKNINGDSKNILVFASTITFICLFWPLMNTYDLFGQQQNNFLWYVISMILVIRKVYPLDTDNKTN